MANRAVFARAESTRVPVATTKNDAGGRAYELDARHALALYATTGTFNGTYYAKAEDHIERIKALLAKLGPSDVEFIAKLAVYAREKGFMKDAPALLLAWLMSNDTGGTFFARAFPRVIRNGKMLATFWQVLNSGVAGRKGIGSRPKRIIQRWFEAQSPEFLFKTSIGVSKPGLADVLRAVHPRPSTPERRALYGYLSGRNRPEYASGITRKDCEPSMPTELPALVKQVEAFKLDPAHTPVPDVDFRLLSSMPLSSEQWTEIALRASWQTLRMNLNTFARHGVFGEMPSKEVRTPVFKNAHRETRDVSSVVKQLAAKLRDRNEILRAKVFPYQLLAAYRNVEAGMPRELIDALHDAMEVAAENVPVIDGNIVICPDVSGSMSSPVTGDRGIGATSSMRCIDVAAMFASCILRKNTSARIIPFETDVVDVRRMPKIEPRDTILTNAEKLGSIGGGGTNCAAPLVLLNREKAKVDAVIYVSDNESWVDSDPGLPNRLGTRGTGTMNQWVQLRDRNPNAKLICIDLTPRTNSQTSPDPSILNVGGFSDEVFTVAGLFLSGQLARGEWLKRIEEVEL